MRKVLFIIAVLLFCGCHQAGSTASGKDSVTFTDDYGRTVSVPATPTRIVSTSPAVTELLFAIGAQDLLVGRTDYCTYPPAASAIPSIGGISNLNVEAILALQPDLIISGSMIPKKSTLQLEKMGVATVSIIEQHRFEGLYDNIHKIGLLTGRSHSADSLVRRLQDAVAALPAQSTYNVPSVYYVVGFGAGGNFTAGGNTFINDIITLAGGRNIAADITGWSYSLETLLNEDPDFVIIRREDSAAFCRTAPYARLTAVQNNHVIGIESGTIDLQVPRNVEAIKTLSRAISEK